MSKKIIIGISEKILLTGKNSSKKLTAKIDTGATRSSMHTGLAKKLKLGPVVKKSLVKSAHGSRYRPVIKASLKIAGKRFNCFFTLADRTHMKYKVLIGLNVLKRHNFLINPKK